MNSLRVSNLQISKSLYLYITYILFLSMTDILALPLFYLGQNRLLPIVILISFIMSVCLAKIFSKYCEFECKKSYKSRMIYFALIFAIAFLRSLAPDTSHDVSIGRVYWQIPGFADNVHENVFPAGFTFFFPLSDRLFYYPRMLLGYRMGTLFNAMLMILIFNQVCNLYDSLQGECLQKLRIKFSEKSIAHPGVGILVSCINKELFAFMTVSLYYVFADLGTYMIDLAAIPLLLWMLNHISSKKENAVRPQELLFVATLCGLMFALKFTNIIFIAPMLLVYLWQNRKAIHPKVFFSALLLGLLPSIPYFVYAYTSTGNPVYWTFNTIFKSPYYPDTNFKDTRWGPQNWKEFIFWPIHLIIHPTENISEISKWPQIYLLLGYLGAGYVLIKSVVTKRRNYAMLASMFFAFTLLWLKSTGYPRYAIICEMLAVFMALVMIVEFLQSNSRLKNGVSVLLLASLIAQCALNTAGGALNLYDWSFREPINRGTLSGTYKLNAKYAFRDQGKIGTEEQRNKVDIFLSTHFKHSIMKVFNKDAKIINGKYIVNNLAAVKESKGIDYPTYYFDEIREEEKNGAGIYDIGVASQYEEFIEGANSVGAEIISMEEIPGYFVGRDTPILIGYSMTGRENTCTDLQESAQFTFEKGTEQVYISGIACFPSYVQWDSNGPILQITAIVQDETTELFTLEIPQHEYIQLDESLDISELSKDGDVTITIQDIGDQQIKGNIINLSVIGQS